jgi:hypothetical protein
VTFSTFNSANRFSNAADCLCDAPPAAYFCFDLCTLAAQLRQLLPFGVGNLLRVLAMQQLIVPDRDARVLLRVIFDALGQSGRRIVGSLSGRRLISLFLGLCIGYRLSPGIRVGLSLGFNGTRSLVPCGGVIKPHQLPLPGAIVAGQDVPARRGQIPSLLGVLDVGELFGCELLPQGRHGIVVCQQRLDIAILVLRLKRGDWDQPHYQQRQQGSTTYSHHDFRRKHVSPSDNYKSAGPAS